MYVFQISQVNAMKRLGQNFIISLFIVSAIIGYSGATFAAVDVCSEGLGEPPFLSYGVDSNLLLLIDNSGSMLDPAYIDEDLDPNAPGGMDDLKCETCYDNTYLKTSEFDATTPECSTRTFTDDPTLQYAGYFEREAWYEWVDGIAKWTPNTAYVAGDLAVQDDIIYVAVTSGTSTAGVEYLEDDVAVTWRPINQPALWEDDTVFLSGTFVQFAGQLYYTIAGGTSDDPDDTDGVTILDDAGVTWVPVAEWADDTAYAALTFVTSGRQLYYTQTGGTSNDPDDTDGVFIDTDVGVAWQLISHNTWRDDFNYELDALVTHNSMLFEAIADPAVGDDIWDDTIWERKDEGYFQKSTTLTSVADFCNGGGTKRFHTDVCVAGTEEPLLDSGGAPILDASGAPSTFFSDIQSFAARGNFLNWALSSKFDVEKEILTGGKFIQEAERLVSEGRGCTNNRFTKEIDLDNGKILTIAVKGATDDNRIDHVDNTTRFEILGITNEGFTNYDSCQEALEEVEEGNPGGLVGGSAGNPIYQCLEYGANVPSPAASALPAFNGSIQYCLELYDDPVGEVPQAGGKVNQIGNDCEAIYNAGIPPSTIDVQDRGYVCYGEYDATQPDDWLREGFLGRCYEPAILPVGCIPVPCNDPDGDGDPTNDVDVLPQAASPPYHDPVCIAGVVNDCSGVFRPNPNKNQSICGKPWIPRETEIIPGACALPSSPAIWTDDAFDATRCAGLNIDAGKCFQPDVCQIQALNDFCGTLRIAEGIDPSDQASATSTFWGIPGMLVDMAIEAQFGHPLAVMKGYIARKARPTGVLHTTADSLRLGAMAFNDNGAYTECLTDNRTDVIEKYCPAGSLDGAKVIKPIRLGSLLALDRNGNGVFDKNEDLDHDGYFDSINEDSNGDGVLNPGEDLDGDNELDTGEDLNGDGIFSPADVLQVDTLVDNLNMVRATSWTPLGEAMYNAIGYYTQNPDVRINDTDFLTDVDVIAGWQNNHVYAPSAYILEGGTLYQTTFGGLSSGDASNLAGGSDTGVDWNDLGTINNWQNNTPYDAYDIIRSNDPTYGDKLFITYSGGTSELKGGAPNAGALYDKGVMWEPLIDPIAYPCQDNHVLIITEGASTADIHSEVADFVNATAGSYNTVPIADPADTAADNVCTDGLQGSTYLDDLTYFANDPDDLFTVFPDGATGSLPYDNGNLPEGDFPFDAAAKKKITTHIVVAGALRDAGAEECNPATLIEAAATNGGTSLLRGENPDELERSLLEFFNELRQRASAGSAASVISSARGGEGAIYQAIFWPELSRMDIADVEYIVDWAGDVHGLFLTNRGFMFEDTNGDRIMEPFEDIDGDGNLDVNESIGEDLDEDGYFDDVYEDVSGDGNLDVAEDVDGDNYLDTGEDVNHNGILDVGEDLDGDGILDLTEDLDGDGVQDVDIDGDGNFDSTYEDVDRDGTLDINEDLDDYDGDGIPEGDGNLDVGEDINMNGFLDPGEDIDGDGVLDLTEDLNNDGVFDPFLDLDGDGHRDEDEDFNGDGVLNGVDRRIIVYFDKLLGRSMACYNTSIFFAGTCNDFVELSEVNFLWSAAEWLATGSSGALNTADNRAVYISNEDRRYIYTWNDLNNDGIVDHASEYIPFVASKDWGDNTGLDNGDFAPSGRGPVASDFDLTNDFEIDNLITWLRGEDYLSPEDPNGNGVVDPLEPGDINGDGILRGPQRLRQLPEPAGSNNLITWRLGDIIHSTPMTVTSPAEGFHLIYNDFTFAQFLSKYLDRRHMVYFGAGDGMFHAVNAGFYSAVDKKFCLAPLNADGTCTDGGGSYPALGTEMWAYVPYNLLPHLKCLDDPNYVHKYFIDQRPRIFDMQIFPEEIACTVDIDDPGCIHPNGWGTILVGGMRFGGAPIDAVDLNGDAADLRQFTSSYFIFDITDPENPPVLLGEFTRTTEDVAPSDGVEDWVDIGYTTVIPAATGMKDTNDVEMYLIFGSGPHGPDAMKGVSDQDARIAILPMDRLVHRPAAVQDAGGNDVVQAAPGRDAFRIPVTPPVTGVSQIGTFVLPSLDLGFGGQGFTSDMITVDFDINPSYEQYKSDVVYFGTVEGDFGTRADGTTFWNGGGKMYRLITKPIVTPAGLPWSEYGLGATEGTTEPGQWLVMPLIDLTTTTLDGNNFWHPNPAIPPDPENTRYPQPITAAASVGTDGFNYWVYFGTGRFYDADDKTDNTQQTYYGIKEPILIHEGKKYLKWYETAVNPTGTGFTGNLGLTRVDDILVKENAFIKNAELSCRSKLPDTTDYICLPPLVASTDPTLKTLEKFIGGTKLQRKSGGVIVDISGNPIDLATTDCWDYNGCSDGWYKDFHPYANRERNVGQATLLGGLCTFTTYQPFNDVCRAEGNAYLYAVYYRTGTAWHENIFGELGLDSGRRVKDKLDLGRGLATTPNLHVGSGSDDGGHDGPKAFIQTSTGAIMEIQQDNMPVNFRTGPSKWKEYYR